MRVRDRVILFFGGLVLTLLFLVAVAISSYPVAIKPEQLATFWQTMIESRSLRWLSCGASLLLLLFSLRFLWISLPFVERKIDGVQQTTDIGPIHISRQTIEMLILRAVKRVRGVHDVTMRVRLHRKSQAVRIDLKITVDGRRAIPELSAELQEHVKELLSQVIGIAVDDVTVYVKKVTVETDGSILRVN